MASIAQPMQSEMASLQAPAAAIKPRLLGPDILRGFLLLWMTLTHMPTSASVVSNQTFGLVSAAASFIFRSTIMVSRLKQDIGQKNAMPATFRDLLKRTIRVYLYHCG